MLVEGCVAIYPVHLLDILVFLLSTILGLHYIQHLGFTLAYPLVEEEVGQLDIFLLALQTSIHDAFDEVDPVGNAFNQTILLSEESVFL